MVTNVALALAHSLGREQQRRKVSIGVALWVLEQYGMEPNVHLGDFGGDEERNQQHMVHHSTTGILAGIYSTRPRRARGTLRVCRPRPSLFGGSRNCGGIQKSSTTTCRLATLGLGGDLSIGAEGGSCRREVMVQDRMSVSVLGESERKRVSVGSRIEANWSRRSGDEGSLCPPKAAGNE